MINHNGILEDYRAIIRSDNRPQVTKLVKAYIVFYDWNDNSYTVSVTVRSPCLSVVRIVEFSDRGIS